MTGLAGYFADPMLLASGFALAAASGDVPAVSSATDYAGGRRVIYEAFSQVVSRPPTPYELQAIEAIALHETGLGQIGQFADSHNWGAVQCPGTWGATECPPGCTMGKDQAPGTGPKAVCFRSYPDDVAGAADLVRNVTLARPRTQKALATGDADAIAGAMYAERYYTGTSPDAATNIATYAKGIARRASEVAMALREPVRVRRYPMAPPSAGSAVLATAFAALALRHHLAIGAGPEDAVTSGIADWIPTFITPDDARRYVREYDAQWQRVAQDIDAAAGDQITPQFRQSWATDYEAWQRFRDDSLANVGWTNTRAVMEQTDRWAAKLIAWREHLTAAKVPVTGPGAMAPGQGLGGPKESSMLGSGWMQLALLVAALFGGGYLIRGLR